MATDAPNTIRFAVVQALDGHLTCVGPDDFDAKDHTDAMSAAIGWHLEAGHLPAATYWITAELPPVPTVPELRAQAEAGTFPKAFIDEIDEDAREQGQAA